MANNQSQFHTKFKLAGAGKHWPELLPWVKSLPSKTKILDWGCGNGGTVRWLRNYTDRFIQGYDPYHPDHNKKPTVTFQAVYSSDVWEHVPAESMHDAWAEIRSMCDDQKLVRQCHIIDCTPAKKTFDDGTNAHCSLHSPQQWMDIMEKHMTVQSSQVIHRPDELFGTRVRVMIVGMTRWA